MLYGNSVRARTVITGAVVAAAVVLAVAVVWLTGRTGLPPQGVPEPVASSSTAAPTAANPDTPPAPAEISGLESALRSADAASISRYVPPGPGQALETGFPEQVAAMELSIDPASLKELDPGVWRVTAVDSTGGTWAVGLVRRGEQLVMFSAEKAGAE